MAGGHLAGPGAFRPPLEASPSNCRLRTGEMCPGARDGDGLSLSSPGRCLITGNAVFSSLFLKIAHSVPSLGPHPSPGHRNVSAAASSSQVVAARSAGCATSVIQRPAPRMGPAGGLCSSWTGGEGRSPGSQHGALTPWPLLLPPVPLPDARAGSASPEIRSGSFVLAASQQLLAQPQKSLLAPSPCKCAQAVLKTGLVYSIRHSIHARAEEIWF